MKDYVHSLGGKATAIKSREQALKRYYNNPNFCKKCGNIIEVKDNQKVPEVRKKVFCSHSCAQIFNNSLRGTKPKIKKEKKIIPKFNFLLGLTKKEIFDKHKNWQAARTSIRIHAQHIFETEIGIKECMKCGYNKHIEIAHIKSVSSFSDNSFLEDINSKDNLMALCPNCHWEFDNL